MRIMKVIVADTALKLRINLLSLRKSPYIACDLETTGLDFRKDDIVGIGFYGESNGLPVAFHIPVVHTNFKCLDRETILKYLIPFFADTSLKICMHNGNFDRHFLEAFGIPVKNFWMDTMYAYHLIDDNADLALKKIIPAEYNVPTDTFKTLFTKRKPIWESNPSIYTTYILNDCQYTYWLARDCDRRLQKENLHNYFFKLEMPTLHTIFDMEKRGIHIDVSRLKKYGKQLTKNIEQHLSTIFRLTGDPKFNPNSTPQMRKIVFQQLGAPVLKVSKKTQEPSCDVEVMKRYARQNRNKALKDFARAILQYRKDTKMNSTYVEGILNNIVNGKINPNFHLKPVTGRLSSSNPNAQNIPARSEIRHCFIAPKGFVIIDFDFSQIELRITAHVSKDANLTKAYLKNEDIHQQTADACGCTRDYAKTINFGLIYMMHWATLAKALDISDKEAETYHTSYFGMYDGVARWHKRMINYARINGCTKTILGRPRRLLDIKSHNKWHREKAEREGVNHRVQGTAGELCKLAMIDCNNSKTLKRFNCKLISQVHDELMFRCPVHNAKKAVSMIKSLMEQAFEKRGVKLDIPIIADGKYALNWGDAH